MEDRSMIRPVTSADRAVLRELLAEFYDTDAVLHPLPASYHVFNLALEKFLIL